MFEFKCSVGLLFDVLRQICDFKANVDNCDVTSGENRNRRTECVCVAKLDPTSLGHITTTTFGHDQSSQLQLQWMDGTVIVRSMLMLAGGKVARKLVSTRSLVKCAKNAKNITKSITGGRACY